MLPTPTNTLATIRGSSRPVFCFAKLQALFVNSKYFVSSGFLLTTKVSIFLPMSKTLSFFSFFGVNFALLNLNQIHSYLVCTLFSYDNVQGG